jgi:hypothetical protein
MPLMPMVPDVLLLLVSRTSRSQCMRRPIQWRRRPRAGQPTKWWKWNRSFFLGQPTTNNSAKYVFFSPFYCFIFVKLCSKVKTEE